MIGGPRISPEARRPRKFHGLRRCYRNLYRDLPVALVLDWKLDASAAALLAQLGSVAVLYLTAVARAKRCDRRGRQWPKHRTFFFLAGLATAGIDLCSRVGTEADTRLSAHMLEHMILWTIVAPLLAAGAPVRLAFRSLPRAGRRQLARYMHSRMVSALTSPVGSVSLFCAVILVTHILAVYGLALTNECLHETEHGLYLLTALLVSAPLIGADPRGRAARAGARISARCTRRENVGVHGRRCCFAGSGRKRSLPRRSGSDRASARWPQPSALRAGDAPSAVRRLQTQRSINRILRTRPPSTRVGPHAAIGGAACRRPRHLGIQAI
jgi:hypothetical protein